jgi:hypothetical protein
MSFHSRLVAGALFALAPLCQINAQNAGKTLAMDFRATVSVQGQPDTSVIIGHAVGNADKMRLDVKGAPSQRSTLTSDSVVTMVVTDSGKTITFLDSKQGQYFQVRPAEMVSQAQQMGAMKMEFSGTQAKVDSLGAGPSILGHPTTHYRVTTGMTMTVNAMGQQQVVKFSSVADNYYATDLTGSLNPFSSVTSGDMASMFASSNADFAKQLKEVRAKLPKGTQLRALNAATIVAQGQTRVTTSLAEVTGLQWVNSDPKAFDIPASFKQVPLPGLAGPAASGAIPPK